MTPQGKQLTPQGITCKPSPQTASSDTSDVYPVDTCGLGIAPMHQRGINNPLVGAI